MQCVLLLTILFTDTFLQVGPKKQLIGFKSEYRGGQKIFPALPIFFERYLLKIAVFGGRYVVERHLTKTICFWTKFLLSLKLLLLAKQIVLQKS